VIVRGDDGVVIELNRKALAQLRCEKRLEVVPGATQFSKNPARWNKLPDSRANGSSSIFEACATKDTTYKIPCERAPSISRTL
jgi:hypothetical protein